jgi:CRP/FNR family cyclic AMP-dependent transcriptional regulator
MASISPETFAVRFPQLASSLTAGESAKLLDAFELHDAGAGEALVAEGTSTSDLFLVLDGQLDILVSGRWGERKLAELGPGSYFGEVSLLDPGPAGASIVTEQGCVVLRLSRDAFDELKASDPSAAAPLLSDVTRSLSNRVRSAAAQLEQLR